MNQEYFTFALFFLAGFVMSGGFASRLGSEKKSNRLALHQIQGKLDALLSNAGLEYDPYPNMSPRVMEAIQNNQLIEAIKACRDSTGLGLAEAKEYVEEIMRNQNRR